MQTGNFEGGGKGQPIVKYRDSLPWAHKNDQTDWDAIWGVDSGGLKEPCIT